MNKTRLPSFVGVRAARELGEQFCGFLFLAPIVAWAISFALLVATAHGPDGGFAQLGTIFYGLIVALLLLLPLIGFIAFSIRCGSVGIS